MYTGMDAVFFCLFFFFRINFSRNMNKKVQRVLVYIKYTGTLVKNALRLP